MTQLHDLSLAQLRELEDELRRELTRLERVTGTDASVVSVPAASHEYDGLATALQRRAVARRAEVADALARLAKGRYGVCASCANPIPYGRLLVVPEATRCVSCGVGA